MNKNIKGTMQRLQALRKLTATMPSPLKGIPLQEAIKKMRKVREELWEEKLATSSRHQ